MRAITVEPGRPHSARLEDVAEPSLSDGAVLVQSLALGICGTDREILSGKYGSAPSGEHRLILGHESLGRVLEAPSGSGLKPDDLVVGIVRRPDPVPCCCLRGRRMGHVSQRALLGARHQGSARLRRRTFSHRARVRCEDRCDARAYSASCSSLRAYSRRHGTIQNVSASASGTGSLERSSSPVRAQSVLLAALMGAQRGLDVHVLDHPFEEAKAELVKDLGGSYSADISDLDHRQPDILMECSGAPALMPEVLARTAPARNPMSCRGYRTGT